MQDQGRRLLIAVALALGVMFMWQSFFAPKDEKKPDPAVAQGSGSGSGSAGPTTPVGVPATPAALPAPMALGPEQEIKLVFPMVEATFSNHGGVLKSWHLTDKRYDKDKSKGELLPVVPSTGAFAVNFSSSTYVLPAKTEWVGTKVSDREIVYKLDTNTLEVEKKFVLVPEAYIIKLTISYRATAAAGHEARQLLALTVYGQQDPKDSGGGGQSVAPRRWESATYHHGTHVGTTVGAVIKRPRYEYGIDWTGFEHPYILAGVAPRPNGAQVVDKSTFAENAETGLMRTDLFFGPPDTFKSDSKPAVREAVAYFGPKHYKQMETADDAAGFSTKFKGTIDLGWFGFIGRPLMWLLLKFYAFFQNWGIAIVLLTIVVKSLTIPFTTKSMRSMKVMAVVAPQMKALQEKYKDDKQRLQMETMALYKQHGANPLTGCLPLVLQMPIWLALYRMLSTTGELYNQAFIPGWIDDLTNTDPFHILPIVLMATMFGQARLTPMGPATDPTAKMQQRMMQWGMPLMFGVMSFFFPAGLTLYIFTNTILSALHSIYMNKFDKKSLEIAAKIKAQQEATAAEKDKAAAAKAKPANAKAAAVSSSPEGDDEEGDDAAPASNKPRPAGGPSRKRKKRRR
jgi:YidC/Oxa1 family membrane protein insertase